MTQDTPRMFNEIQSVSQIMISDFLYANIIGFYQGFTTTRKTIAIINTVGTSLAIL